MTSEITPVPTREEVELFFNLQEKIKSHAKEVAKLCTDFGGRDELENIEQIMGGYVRLGVWNSECGHDCYDMPKEYLSMSVEDVNQILEDKKRKERELRRAAAEKAKIKREENRVKREAAKLEKERKEYERLKAKFEGKEKKKKKSEKKKNENTPVYECAHFEFDQHDPSGCGGSWSWCHNEKAGTRECNCKYIYAQQFCPFYERGRLRGKWVISDNEMEAAKMFEKKRK